MSRRKAPYNPPHPIDNEETPVAPVRDEDGNDTAEMVTAAEPDCEVSSELMATT